MELQQTNHLSNERMTLQPEYLELIQRKAASQTTPTQISKKLITAFLTNEEFCKDNLTRLTNALFHITKVYYGLNPENLPEDLFRLVIHTICEKHPTLKFTELNLAYLERTIEKRQGVSLTRDEIMQPIEDMAQKKRVVLMIQEQAKQEFENSQSEKQKIEQFKREAMQLYVTDLEQGNKVYSGTAFQANSFARAFADLFDDNQKKDMWIEAQREYKELNYQYQENANAFTQPPPPAEKLYAKIMVNAALNRGINGNGYLLIED